MKFFQNPDLTASQFGFHCFTVLYRTVLRKRSNLSESLAAHISRPTSEVFWVHFLPETLTEKLFPHTILDFKVHKPTPHLTSFDILTHILELHSSFHNVFYEKIIC